MVPVLTSPAQLLWTRAHACFIESTHCIFALPLFLQFIYFSPA